MKKRMILLMCCLMLCKAAGAAEESATVTGKVVQIQKYGHAVLDITVEEFQAAGFELGDIVTVKAGSYEGDMPYFNGYYVDMGEYMVRSYQEDPTIAVCINYGHFADTAGVSTGDVVTITMMEKAGALDVQEINSLVYTDERADYASDEIFANFREIRMGGIGEHRLYRSGSPINNSHHRSAFANRLMEEAGIQTVLNLSDSDKEVRNSAAREDFDSSYYMDLYENGHVLALGLPINFTTDEFAEGIVKGLVFLSGQEAPFLVHCVEGRDRAGFVSMVLEALMGAAEEEIVADYLASYVNYYHLDPDADAVKLETIAEKNIREMLRAVAGLEKGADLAGVDLAAATEKYLLSHGMEADALETLKAKLR